MLKFLDSIIKNTIKKVEVGICQMRLICLLIKIIEPLILQRGIVKSPSVGAVRTVTIPSMHTQWEAHSEQLFSG